MLDILQLNIEISKLKKQISLLLEKDGNTLDYRVLELSKKLDMLILTHLDEQIKSKASLKALN